MILSTDTNFVKQLSVSEFKPIDIRKLLLDLVDERDQLKLVCNQLKMRADNHQANRVDNQLNELKARNNNQTDTILEFQKQVRQLQDENQLSEEAINSMRVACLNQSKLIEDDKRTIKNVNERVERQKQELIKLLDLNTELKARLEDINRRSALSNMPVPKTVLGSDECNCPVCVDMRSFRAEALKRAETNERDDVFGDCPCPDCVAARSVARAKAYLAERRAVEAAREDAKAALRVLRNAATNAVNGGSGGSYGARPSNRSYNPYGATDRRS